MHKKLCREKIVNPDTHVSVDLGAEGIAKEKVASHSENVLQAAQKIFNNKVKSFLMEANAADLQIMDCIVVIGKSSKSVFLYFLHKLQFIITFAQPT